MHTPGEPYWVVLNSPFPFSFCLRAVGIFFIRVEGYSRAVVSVVKPKPRPTRQARSGADDWTPHGCLWWVYGKQTGKMTCILLKSTETTCCTTNKWISIFKYEVRAGIGTWMSWNCILMMRLKTFQTFCLWEVLSKRPKCTLIHISKAHQKLLNLGPFKIL